MSRPFLFAGLTVRLERCAETAATILKCEGVIDADNAPALRSYIGRLIADPLHNHLRVDLGQIWELRPCGVRTLLNAQRDHAGRFSLGTPPPISRPLARVVYDRELEAASA